MTMQYGIWLDSDQAHIISLTGESELMDTIESGVEHFHLHGGAKTSTPYGAQMTSSNEGKLLERKKHQMSTFFNTIISKLNGASEIAIFGPAETKVGLKKALESHPALKDKRVTVEAADSMTHNQVRALVRNHFQKQ